MLTLTGPNTYTGGTEIWDGWLQVGDGQTYGSMITGAVEDDSTGGLTFDIAPAGSMPLQDFNGAIYTDSGNPYGSSVGSVLKTGRGGLKLTFDAGASGYSSFAYSGELRVEAGALTLGASTPLPSGTSLTVENGAALNLGGNSVSLTNVTLNGGSIINGTIYTTGCYNVSSGTISANLDGPAALIKRTSGAVNLTGNNNYGDTFIDEGNLNATASPQTVLTWAGGSGNWDSSNWLNSGQLGGWHDGDIAAFDGSGGAVTITAQVSPVGIEFEGGNYDLVDGGSTSAELVIPSSGMLVTVAASAQATTGCWVGGDGSLTMEGPGNLALGTAAQVNPNSYTGGTFIDAGTVEAGNQNALGSGELTVDETGVLDLNGNNISVLSLSSAGLQSGTVTDNSFPTGITSVLTLNVGSNPGVFGGVIQDGANQTEVGLNARSRAAWPT